MVLAYHSSASWAGTSAEHMYTGTSVLSQKSVWQGTWSAPTERSGLGGVSLRSPGLRGVLPRNSRKSVCAAYRMYWRLQQARSCWFLHCANVGTAKKHAQKRQRSHEIFPFMRACPCDEAHLCCKQGQSRECPSGSERVLHRHQLRTNHPAVGKQTDGIAGPRVAHLIGIGFPRAC